MKIGFIGLGNMGAPMAHNLLKAGHALNVFDLNAQAVQALVDAGAKAAGSPKAAVTDVECVITMLPAAAHVRSVLSADDGVFAGIAKGVTIIDSSTIDPASVTAFAELAAQHGNTFVDAPVSGGTGGAAAGTLTFMVGGSASAYEQVKPVLGAMGRNIVHCGGTGTGRSRRSATTSCSASRWRAWPRRCRWARRSASTRRCSAASSIPRRGAAGVRTRITRCPA
jgi:3-hydroxyisobutyrate dehydrogenase